MAGFDDMPDELVHAIAIVLNLADLGRLHLVSRKLNGLLSEQPFWRAMCMKFEVDVSCCEQCDDFKAYFIHSTRCLVIAGKKYICAYDGAQWVQSQLPNLLGNRGCRKHRTLVFAQDTEIREVDIQTGTARILPGKLSAAQPFMTLMYVNMTGVLYAFGCESSLRGIFALSPQVSGWRRVGSLHCPKQCASGGVIGGKVYITDPNSTECFDPTTNVCSMLSGRSAFHTAAFVYRNKLYTAGGLHVGAGCNDNSFACYDPMTDEWQQLAHLNTRRNAMCLTLYNERLWAIGGRSENTDYRVVESYDFQHNVWTMEKPLPVQVEGISAVVLHLPAQSRYVNV